VVGGSVDGLRAELVSREHEFSADAQAVLAQLEALRNERAGLDDRGALNRAQAQIGSKYNDLALQQISKEMALEKPDLKAWQLALDASFGANLAAIKAQAEITAREHELQHRQAELDLKLSNVRQAADKHSWTVEVLASCPGGQTAELELTYLVGGASWTPAYEARADEAGGAVDLSTWATISQHTGEAWDQVKLVLSTAVPSQNATPPELKKLMVEGAAKEPEKKVLVRRDETVQHARAEQAERSPGTSALEAAEQGLSVQLSLPEKAKVAGDGAPVRLFVGKTHLKATFEVAAFPRLNPVAFRVAKLVNQAPWPLLDGRIDAFRATGLVGRYSLARVAQGAPFAITFGVDDSVRVKRFTLDELKRDTGIFSDRKRFTYAYRFELANYGKAGLEVDLSDQLPISELNDITVAMGEKTTAGYQLDPRDGIARWRVALKPGEKKSVELSFRVDVPNSYELSGL
jgi:uncharacterized protein (TIGR02231 family)